MLISSAIATFLIGQEAKLLPEPTLFVDGLAIASIKSKKWTLISGPLKTINPFKAYQLELARVAQLTSVYDLEFMEGIDGNFLPGHLAVETLWSGPKPKYPRSIRTVSPNQADYLALVKDFVRSEIKREPDFVIEINSISRVDLDGDGNEEVIIEANHEGFYGEIEFGPRKIGQMSCTLVRHIKNGKPTTEPLFFFHSAPGPEPDPLQVSRLKAIADFDGDGKYEVVVTADYYEGQSASVYNLLNGKLIKLVENGAGV